MATITLSEARVKALRPRKAAYDIRDAKLKGFGVRVLPSAPNASSFTTSTRGQRNWKTLGDANTMTLDEARTRAASMLAAIRIGSDTPLACDTPCFEVVAEAVFQRHAHIWKAKTLYVNRSYYRRQILPWFGRRSIADIGRQDVQRWFASLRATPVAADRSMPILSIILKEAELMGHRARGLQPLSGDTAIPAARGANGISRDEELRRLAARLAAKETERPLQVAAIRLLLLTGCRRGEVLTLRWSDYREGRLFLQDSKTGPRTVWLSRAARHILDNMDRTGTWVFRGGVGIDHQARYG